MEKDENEKPKFTYEELAKKYLENKKETNDNSIKDFASDYQMIVTFIVSILLLLPAGIYLGYLLDNLLKTTPLFILFFAFLGIATSYRNLFKDANRKK